MASSRAGNFFIAGGSYVLVPNGSRVAVLSQALLRAGPLLQLESLGVNSQEGSKVDLLVELLHNGDRVHVETLNKVGFSSDCYALPFYRIEPIGVLELYITNTIPGGFPTTLTGMILGRYVSGD